VGLGVHRRPRQPGRCYGEFNSQCEDGMSGVFCNDVLRLSGRTENVKKDITRINWVGKR
jgi:hypothetical protein